MSTTIAHPGRIPTSGPSRRGVLAVLIGFALVAGLAVGILNRGSDDGSTSQAEVSDSVSPVDEAMNNAQIEEIKEMARSTQTVDGFETAENLRFGALAPSVDSSSQAAENLRFGALAPSVDSSSQTAEMIRFSQYAPVAATSAADSQAAVWQSRVDYLTEQYLAQVDEDLDIPPHFVE